MKKFEFNLDGLTEIEKQQLLDWAQKVRAIQKDTELNRSQKIEELKKLNHSTAFKNSANLVLRKFKKYWKGASWKERLAILAGGTTFAFYGVGGAGIAAFGGAIGFPLFLLTAGGAWFIGMIIDRLSE